MESIAPKISMEQKWTVWYSSQSQDRDLTDVMTALCL